MARNELEAHEEAAVKLHLHLLYEAFQSRVTSLTEWNRSLQKQIEDLQKGETVASELVKPRSFTATWTIEDWKEKLEVAKNEDMSLISRPFYISGRLCCVSKWLWNWQRNTFIYLFQSHERSI